MNKQNLFTPLFICLVFLLTGCVKSRFPEKVDLTPSSSPTPASSLTPPATQTSLPIPKMPTELSPSVTATLLPTMTFIPSPTPHPTFQPDQAVQAVFELMQGNDDCSTPCFWGIIPGISDLDQTTAFFTQLGFSMSLLGTNPVEYGASYDFKKDMHIYVTYQGENNKIRNIQAVFNGLNSPELDNSDWVTFRPDSILRTYGVPSRVVFFLEYPTEPTTDNTVGYDFDFFYDNQHLVITYWGQRVVDRDHLYLCPLIDAGIVYFQVWIGENFDNIPGGGVEVPDVTSLSLDDFYSLMVGDPSMACFFLDTEAYFHVLFP